MRSRRGRGERRKRPRGRRSGMGLRRTWGASPRGGGTGLVRGRRGRGVRGWLDHLEISRVFILRINRCHHRPRRLLFYTHTRIPNLKHVVGEPAVAGGRDRMAPCYAKSAVSRLAGCARGHRGSLICRYAQEWDPVVVSQREPHREGDVETKTMTRAHASVQG